MQIDPPGSKVAPSYTRSHIFQHSLVIFCSATFLFNARLVVLCISGHNKAQFRISIFLLPKRRAI